MRKRRRYRARVDRDDDTVKSASSESEGEIAVSLSQFEYLVELRLRRICDCVGRGEPVEYADMWSRVPSWRQQSEEKCFARPVAFVGGGQARA